VGYLNGTTGGFGASYIFMAGSLLLSAIITIIAVKESGTALPKTTEEANLMGTYPVAPRVDS
jgi:hypothetical protein